VSLFRQSVIVTVIIGSMLNAAIVVGALGGYTFYANVLPVDAPGAERFGLWVEIVLVVLGVLAWVFSRPGSDEDEEEGEEE